MEWHTDIENAPRSAEGSPWIVIAFRGDAGLEARQARWAVDRWMTPYGFVSPKVVYAWAERIEPPDQERDALDLV